MTTAPEPVQVWIGHLPFPPMQSSLTANSIHGRQKTKRYRNWIIDAGKELMIQRPHKFLSPVRIDLCLGLPDKRRRDVSNAIKAIEDLLVRHGVVQDDSWQFVEDVRSRVDRGVASGRVRVTVERVRGLPAGT